jgi:hypothetical protein
MACRYWLLRTCTFAALNELPASTGSAQYFPNTQRCFKEHAVPVISPLLNVLNNALEVPYPMDVGSLAGSLSGGGYACFVRRTT